MSRRVALGATAASLAAALLYSASRPRSGPPAHAPGGLPQAAAFEHSPSGAPAGAAPARTPERVGERSAAPARPAPAAPGPGPDHRDLLRSTLARELAERLPSRTFSSGDIEHMTDALLAVRAARAAVQASYRDAAAMRGLAAAQRELARATQEFETIAGMSPAELTTALEPEVGLTVSGNEHDAPVLEILSPP